MITWEESWFGSSIMHGQFELAFVSQDDHQWYWRANFPGDFKAGRGFIDGKKPTKTQAQRAAIETLKSVSIALLSAVEALEKP